VKIFRPHRSSRAEVEAKPARDLPNRARQVVDLEQRETRRLQLPSVHRSPSQNVVARQNDDQARNQMQGNARQNRSRHRIGNEDLSVSDSAHQRLETQVNRANAAEVRHRSLVKR
jgi:hypothetical protein